MRRQYRTSQSRPLAVPHPAAALGIAQLSRSTIFMSVSGRLMPDVGLLAFRVRASGLLGSGLGSRV
eukprot:2387534-Rhodomonas_salina.1